MTTIPSIDLMAGGPRMPLGELASQTLANGVELEAAVAAFQRAMAEIGFPKAEVPTVPVAAPETLKAAIVENAKVAAELPRPVELPATPETFKAVLDTNVKLAAALPEIPGMPKGRLPIVPPDASVPATVDSLKAAIAENAKLMPQVKSGMPVEKGQMSRDADGPEASVVLQAAPGVAEPAIAAEVTVKTVTHAAVDGVESVRRVARVTGTDVLVEAAHAVVDTMMVSPGLMRGEGEVRVVLKPEVLEGTELRISATGGTLSVEFMPKAGPIAEFLTANQPQLVQRLAEKIHNFQIAVSVNTRRDGRKERV